MTDNDLNLSCLVDGESTPFSVDIKPTKTVDHLKKAIKLKNPETFIRVDVKDLTIWKVSIPVLPMNDRQDISLSDIPTKDKLHEMDGLVDVFRETPPKETIHIIVQRPPQDEKWREFGSDIEDEFFAPASVGYTSLGQFVKDGANIPTTRGALSGLPFVAPRAGALKDRPSLLFLNLPESSEIQDPPSTADKALEKIYGRDVPLRPLFGVSGCGKTRTAIEMLSKNWGFYFNASATDWDSSDLLLFSEMVKVRSRYQQGDPASRTHVQTLAQALVLTRVMTLHHCFEIAERVGAAFAYKNWMLLQVGFRSMYVVDLFALFFTSFAHVIRLHSINNALMGSFVRVRFSQLRHRLLKHTFNTPSQRVNYKILLVVDEAGNQEYGILPSQQTPPEHAL
ncbi:hypothetical protein BGZ96_012608 [Linnemannia gamsii]|uniref:Crinkler effector protein N-terminal domain-containing protein n=1 Tax=Linnemannia gamsii TaxID=64522 RepID=A0ABQ7JQ43_9FUNG|nr:hypothetical protein BGZ96_012608 [Linnemannia gamsii]